MKKILYNGMDDKFCDRSSFNSKVMYRLGAETVGTGYRQVYGYPEYDIYCLNGVTIEFEQHLLGGPNPIRVTLIGSEDAVGEVEKIIVIEELEKRGYDIETLKFSIQKCQPAVSADAR